MLDSLIALLALVGCYALCCYLYDNLKSPALLCFSAIKRLLGMEAAPNLQERFGKWAAITGATDGIGKAYARELARRGLDVVLISRTAAKLKAVAAAIESDFGVQTKIIVADFTHGKRIYEYIEEQLSDLPVGILVNNVGQNTAEAGSLCVFATDELWDLIHTNIAAVTQMSRLGMRRMHAAGIRGAIVNIASVTALQPCPYVALYAASKAFTYSLTLALQKEPQLYDITVQLVSPNFVHTKLLSSKKTTKLDCFFTDPDQYARWAVGTIGRVNETTGYYWHGLQTAILKMGSYRIRSVLVSLIAGIFYNNTIKTLDTPCV